MPKLQQCHRGDFGDVVGDSTQKEEEEETGPKARLQQREREWEERWRSGDVSELNPGNRKLGDLGRLVAYSVGSREREEWAKKKKKKKRTRTNTTSNKVIPYYPR